VSVHIAEILLCILICAGSQSLVHVRKLGDLPTYSLDSPCSTSRTICRLCCVFRSMQDIREW
jgi:hypothetical protein